MTTTLPLKQENEIQEGMFLRPRDPSNHDQFQEILPWMTPLFCYQMDGRMWVRWSVPPHIGEKLGMHDSACAHCGKHVTTQEDGNYVVDIAWGETSWWLLENGYRLPEVPTP